jgi:hypothetical protein
MRKILLIQCIVLLTVPHLLGQKIQILTNHLGYNPSGPKKAVVLTFQDEKIDSYSIRHWDDGRLITSGKPGKTGPVDQWKNWVFWTIDFTSINQESKYYIECQTNKGLVRSFPFMIQDNILERHTISDVIFYFRGQRCVGLMDKADRKMTFKSGRTDTLDVHGGWHDASGDYGKHLSHLSFSTFFNPQQIPIVVYSLCKTHELLETRKDENFNQFKRRLIDEILHGADYLVRVKNPGGSFYRTIAGLGPGKRPEDRRITPSMKKFAITKKKQDGIDSPAENPVRQENNIYEVGYRSGGGIAIASLAMAYRFNKSGDFNYQTYLQCAEDAFQYLEKYNISLTNDDKENIVDDYCALAASSELFKATGKEAYRIAADKRAENLMNRLISQDKYKDYWRADDGDRPFFHAADAGLPLVSLIYYLDICNPERREKVLSAVEKSLNFELSITSEVPNPFGYARQLVQHKDGRRNSSFFYPHDTETAPWWQGENARLASLACAARLAIPYFKSCPAFVQKLEQYAHNQIDWILGLNPFDACMLHGTGRNNPEYMFFGSYQYTNAPGGICNGITAGLNNEHDIDFNLTYSETGKDYDWRWGEQWLPHAAWYLIAVSARN